MSDPLYLILENGKVFSGRSFGVYRETTAEIVFTTGMTGYLETLTDSSYSGQMVVQTFPLIGNYGMIPEDFESAKIQVSAYIVKEFCHRPSNFRSEGDINTFFASHGIVGLCDVDTRSLTKIIRGGVMKAKITKDPNTSLDSIKNYQLLTCVNSVSVKNPVEYKNYSSKYKVALIDYGFKKNIASELLKKGCDVTILPHDTKACDITNGKFDGIVLSNGPGDPADNREIIHNIKDIMNLNIPIFGICLGHQLLALASGFETRKLKYGHRGANHPVIDLKNNKIYITTQNHGYTVVSESIESRVALESFIDANYRTCEGIEYVGLPIFSVQFHPEACAGPKDTNFLFDKFIKMMEVHCAAK